MDNLSEVLKILDGALKSNASMASTYAGLLADKLMDAGEHQQAKLVRERLSRAPVALAYAQDASRGFSAATLPMDGESRLHTVDISNPKGIANELFLPETTLVRLGEFLDSVRHFDRLAAAGASLPTRLIMHGPPGTGKTQTARWIASRLEYPLATVRCDTLISSLLGQTSRNLRQVFEFSQQAPCVLFLDEFDALAGARGNERDVGELQRVVIALLQNIDALPDSTVLIAATNHDQLLDPAIWRRFSFRIPMTLPNSETRKELWQKFIGDLAAERMNWELLGQRSEGLSGAQIEQICLDSKRRVIIEAKASVEVEDVLRRLSLILAMQDEVRLDSTDDEIAWLRGWDAKVFSLRALAKLYKTTTHHVNEITNQTKKEARRGTERKKRGGRQTPSGQPDAGGSVLRS